MSQMQERKVSRELKEAWHRFIAAPSRSRELQSQLLDTFLVKLIVEYRDVPSSVQLTEWVTAGNVLAHQLMLEVHEACSGDDPAPCREFLLAGRGWKLLWALVRIGSQSLPCCKELSRVAISLLSFFSKLEEPWSPGTFEWEFEERELMACSVTTTSPAKASLKHRRCRQKPRLDSSSDSSDSTDSDHMEVPSPLLRTSTALFLSNKDPLESASEGWEDRLYLRRSAPLEDLLTDEEAKIVGARVAPSFLLNCLVTLLTQSCRGAVHKGDRWQAIATSISGLCLPGALELFNSLSYSPPAGSQLKQLLGQTSSKSLQQKVLRLIVTATSQLLRAGCGYSHQSIRKYRVLLTLLDACQPALDAGDSQSVVENMCAALIFIRDAVRAFPFSEGSLNWIVEAVHRLCTHNSLQVTLRASDRLSCTVIGELLADIILSLKRAKSARRQGVAFHHHDMLLGTQFRHSMSEPLSGCCIASLCIVLLNAPFLSTQALLRCGVCCCMALDEVFVPLLRDFGSQSAGDKHQILQLLQKCLCAQMGLFSQACFSCRERQDRGDNMCMAYFSLLSHGDTETQTLVGRHLLAMMEAARPPFRDLICTQVALPSFLEFDFANATSAEPELNPLWFSVSAFSLLGADASMVFPAESIQMKRLYKLLSPSVAPIYRHAALVLIETLILAYVNSIKTDEEGAEESGSTENSVVQSTSDTESNALSTFTQFLAAETKEFMRKVKPLLTMQSMESLSESATEEALDVDSTSTQEAELSTLAELWLSCRRVAQCSAVRSHLRIGNCCAEAYRFLLWLTDETVRPDPCCRKVFPALETMLALLLQLCPVRLWYQSECLQRKEMVRELRNRLHGCPSVNRTAAEWRCLLDALLSNLVHWTRVPTLSSRPKVDSSLVSRAALLRKEPNSVSLVPTADDELGYEADSESSPDDYAASEGMLSVSREGGDMSVMCYEEVCSLVLDLVCRLCPTRAEVALHAIQRLTTLCSQHPMLLTLFVKQGAVGKLCHGLGCLLHLPDQPHVVEHHTLELQESLVSLLVLFCRRSLSAQDLVAYMGLLKGTQSAFGPILKGLLALASCGDRGPQCWLQFPPLAADDDEVTLLPTPQQNEEERGRQFADLPHGGASNQAVLVLPLEDHGGWCPRREGFSLAFWLALRWSSVLGHESSSRLHLVSLGCGPFLCELWAEDVEKGTVSLWLTQDGTSVAESAACNAASQCSFERVLAGHGWHHLALTYHEHMSQSTSETGCYALVTLTVDGRHSRSWHLPLEGQGGDSCLHQPGPMLLIGQSAGTGTSVALVGGGVSWSLGNLLLFRGSCLGSAECLALYSRGADAVVPTSCILSEDEESARIDISPRLVRKGFLKKKWPGPSQFREVLAVLEDEIMAWFSPQRSDSFVSYPHSSQAFSSFLAASKKRKRSGIPQSKAAHRLSPVQLQWQRQLHHAAASLGGPGLFLFLLARVVECTTEDGPQAAALELALGMLGQPSATWGTPRILVGANEALNLLGQLVENHRWAADSPRCLLVAVNACSSRPLLQWDGEGSAEAVRHPTGQEPLLVWPQLAGTLLEHWRPGSGRQRLLGAMWALLRERHPHRDHNLAQAAPLLGSLLVALRRLLVDESQGSLGPPGTLPLVLKLLGALVPAAGELAQRLSACLDLLLLLHRAANAHVAQGRSSFYSLPPRDCAPTAAGFSIVETSRTAPSSLASSPLSGSFGHLLGMVSRSAPNQGIRKVKEPDAPKVVKVRPNAVPAELYNNLDGNSLVDANLASLHGEPPQPCPALVKPGPKPTATEALSLLLSGEIEASGQSHDRTDEQPRLSCPFESSIRHPMTSSPVPLSPNPWAEMEEEQVEVEDDMTGLVLGLLKLLQDILAATPENVVREKLEPVVQLEALLILAHNENALVRNQVLCVLEVYLSKVSGEVEARFLKARGFQLLGLQLAQYPATAALVQSCCRILLGRPLYLARKIPHGSVPDQASNRASVTLLLSLLPRTVHDPILCCGTLSLLQQLCDNIEGAARLLYSNGLGESLASMIVAAPRQLLLSRSSSTGHGEGFVDLVLALIRSASLATARLAMEQSGKISMECFHSLCSLFARLSEAHNTHCGEACKAVPLFRECQAKLYLSVLEHIESFCTDEKRSQSSPSLLEAFASLPTPIMADVAPLSPDIHHGGRQLNYSNANGPSREFVTPSTSSLSRELGAWFALACDFVIYQELSCERPPTELSLVAALLRNAVAGTALSHLSKKSKRKLSSRERVLSSLKHVFQPQLSRLCVNLLAPGQHAALRIHVAEVLVSCEQHRQALKTTLGSSSDVRLQVRTFVQELLSGSAARFDASIGSTVVSLVAVLAQELPSVMPRNPRQEVHANEEQIKERWLNQWTAQRETWLSQTALGPDRKDGRLRKLEAKASQVVAEGAKVTRSVAELLHALRKEVLHEAKARSGRDLVLKQTWSRLAAQLTHERAPWHLPESFPTAWELDPTEGPSRIRRRLRRAFLPVDPKFIMPQHRKSQKVTLPPLHFLYDADTSRMESAAFLHHLYINERITHTCKCIKICPSSDMPGEVLLGETSLQFVPDQLGKYKGSLGEVEARHEVWPYKDVQEVLLRRFRLRDNALELFLRNGVTALLAFHTTQDRNEFCRQLWQCPHLDLEPSESLESLSHRWQERCLGNFDYLTQLNKMAGRSFNDLMQYPVFPFVLANYADDILDFQDSASFRCLERPMAVQDVAREEHYRRNFRVERASAPSERLHPWLGPFHYGSHYSNSGTVLHFLVRLPPFTQMFLAYQDQQFDLPDRTFHSVHTTWRLASSESTTDVKELIPEFFFLPEFLVNMQGFDYGKRQTGESVSDVLLPPWCRGDPRLFILIHRQALESDYVTEHLGHWIDLVFGYKQTGKAAEEAINVFHPATYYGVDVSSVANDTVSQMALETMIRTYGQMPKQLFSSPHPLVTLSLAGNQGSAASSSLAQATMAEVRGLRWGSYVGSPSKPAARLVLWRSTHKDQSPVSHLVSLRTNDVWGLPAHSCLLLTYSHSSGGSKAALQTYIQSTALVSWQHADGFVRLKLQKDEPAQPLLSPCPGDMVSTCATAPGCPLVFVGYASGLLTAHEIKLANSKVEHPSRPTCLLGHTDAVTRVEVCTAFGLVVTTSRDGSCIAWDLNRLEYVRTLIAGSSPIVLACISSTLGDVATVETTEGSAGSCLRVHTINGARVGQLSTDVAIGAVCYSAAPEGTSINVLAAGCEDGCIRLWSSWDLSPVQEIHSEKCISPIISLAYSQDQQHLYAVDNRGEVFAWEAQDGSRVPRFHVLL
ncbi:lysosomal-trafficking regulator mauve isoform X1 [Dermacentor variabilis]|uniref:lysosomal-trafficking regulator mauve isoform X1 n=1 Tax=Dermacentor variabilis TaxID=34621 RepID=UPI003F5B8E15